MPIFSVASTVWKIRVLRKLVEARSMLNVLLQIHALQMKIRALHMKIRALRMKIRALRMQHSAPI